ncbi:universal stress protein [Echinicola jeungdonensis]|uniref:Universal stress protein n=1 Tax=Echinicola jeungdonensis TaxID=709343 RepID=A0ABV5JBU6_9BACT
MKKILVPCDFSEASHAAFAFASQIASANEGVVEVLHVLEFPFNLEQPYYMASFNYDLDGLFLELKKGAEGRFENMKAPHDLKGTHVNFNVLHGTVAKKIEEFVGEKGIELIVIGTEGHSQLHNFFVGSNTEKVIRRSEVPVITLKKSIPLNIIKDIVLPIDFKPLGEEWENKIKYLQGFFKAKLHLVFINTPSWFMEDSLALDKMKQFAEDHQLEGATFNVRNNYHVPDGIHKFAHEIQAGMIALGTHERKGLEHFFGGGVQERMVHGLEVPIWTYNRK